MRNLRIRHRLLIALAAVALGAPLTGPVSAGAQQADDEDVAILDPLLATFEVGSPVGTNLACRTASGAISSGANELTPQASQAVSTFLRQLNDACRRFIELNSMFITAGQDGVGPLAVINPAVNPGIQLFAQSMRDGGNSMGNLLFGRTVAQLGDTLAYFDTARG